MNSSVCACRSKTFDLAKWAKQRKTIVCEQKTYWWLWLIMFLTLIMYMSIKYKWSQTPCELHSQLSSRPLVGQACFAYDHVHYKLINLAKKNIIESNKAILDFVYLNSLCDCMSNMCSTSDWEYLRYISCNQKTNASIRK